jgi:cysteine-rich repeat protein
MQLGLVWLLFTGSASAQLTTTKYGLADPSDFAFRRHPTDDRAFLAGDFSGSYFFVRSNPANEGGLDCGIDRDYTPVLGQVLLREDNRCVPTSTGPTCTAGTRIGSMCHLPLGQNTAANTLECGTAGVCTLVPGGCPVEIPKTLPSTPADQRSDWVAPIWSKNAAVGFELLSLGAFSFGGSSSPDPQDDCLPENIRLDLVMGQRYLLPASRGGDGTRTYIRWNESTTSGLYRHGDDTKVCCNSESGTLCSLIGNFTEYPLLRGMTCSDPRTAHVFVQTPDWIFEGRAGTDFHTDPEFTVPGQQVGVCRNNRDKGCSTLAAPFPQGTDCAALDADPGVPGLQPDSCDFRDPGLRSTRPANLPSGYPNTAACANSAYVLRGTAGANCFLMERYAVDGDPGPGCEVPNFGARPRPDLDCDGLADAPDRCPLLNEFDPFADADADCALSQAACRGDECECGDQNLDGRVDVADAVAINAALFGSLPVQTLCDTNLDHVCDVSDLVGANREIFEPGSAVCAQVTTLRCGDGSRDPDEQCDDGNRVSGDGCSAVCRDE